MPQVWIRFASKKDRTDSVYPLLKFTIESIPGDIFGVPEQALQVLKQAKVGFDHVPSEEVAQAVERLRGFRTGAYPTKKQRGGILKSLKSQLKSLASK